MSSYSPAMRGWHRESSNTPHSFNRTTSPPPRNYTGVPRSSDMPFRHRAYKSDSAISVRPALDKDGKVLDFVTPGFISNIQIGQVLRLGDCENIPKTSIFHQQVVGNDSPENHMCVVMGIKDGVAEVCPVTSFHNGTTPVYKRPAYWQSCVWIDSGLKSTRPSEGYPEGPGACLDILNLDRSSRPDAHFQGKEGKGSWVRTDRTFRIEVQYLQRYNFQCGLVLDEKSVGIVRRQLAVWGHITLPIPIPNPRPWSAPPRLETPASKHEQIMNANTWRRD